MRWNWMELPTMQSIAKLTISRRNGFCLAHAHLTAVGSVWILRALLLVLDICTPTKLARFIIQQYDWPRAIIRSTNLYTMIKNMTSVLKRGNLNTGKLIYVYDNKNHRVRCSVQPQLPKKSPRQKPGVRKTEGVCLGDSWGGSGWTEYRIRFVGVVSSPDNHSVSRQPQRQGHVTTFSMTSQWGHVT